MSWNYAAAGRWSDVVHALAITESGGEPTALNVVGDGGRAIGPMQQHPAFFGEFYGKVPHFPQDVTDDWPTAQIKAAASFLELWAHLGRDMVVTAYNQGIHATLSGARAPQYLANFTMAMSRIRGAWPTGT